MVLPCIVPCGGAQCSAGPPLPSLQAEVASQAPPRQPPLQLLAKGGGVHSWWGRLSCLMGQAGCLGGLRLLALLPARL